MEFENLAWDYATDGQGIDPAARQFITEQMYANGRSFPYKGKTLTMGLLPISTFYSYGGTDQLGKQLSSKATQMLKAKYQGKQLGYVVDPNDRSNLDIFNGHFEDPNNTERKGGSIWTIAGRMKKTHLLQHFLEQTPRERRWIIPYMNTMSDIMKSNLIKTPAICLIVKIVKSGNGQQVYSIGQGQAVELKMFSAMLKRINKPVTLYLQLCWGPGSIGNMEQLESPASNQKIEELASLC